MPKIPINAPVSSAKNNPVEEYRRAFSMFCAPRFLLMQLPEPWPNIKPKACKIAIRLKTTPVAPLAEMLIFETK